MKFGVYGTLKEKYGNHRCLGNAKFLGEFKTPANYTLFDGGFPIVERGGKTSISCEIWETDDEQSIDRVFNLEGCHKTQDHPGSWYTYDLLETPHGEVTMFVMNPGTSGRSNDRILESGIWGR